MNNPVSKFEQDMHRVNGALVALMQNADTWAQRVGVADLVLAVDRQYRALREESHNSAHIGAQRAAP